MPIGGGGGIRTRDTVSRIHTFQACAFSRSATPPSRRGSGGESEAIAPAAARAQATIARVDTAKQKQISANKRE